MEGNNHGDAVLDASFFEGRLLVEIEAWDCGLYVRLSSEHTPPQYRFQGGLNLSRSFSIDGRIRAPSRHRGERIHVSLLPFGPEYGSDDVGRLYFHASRPSDRPPLSATLLIPEATLPIAATCLSSIWKYIHIWTFDEDAEQASVSAFGFDAKIHRNLATWVSEA